MPLRPCPSSFSALAFALVSLGLPSVVGCSHGAQPARSGASLASASDLGRLGDAGVRAIEPASLSAHVRFLAHDQLEGRGTGTRGHTLAAEYVAAQMMAQGLEPAGERGTYFQRVPLLGVTVRQRDSQMTIRRGGQGAIALRPMEDVLFSGSGTSDREDATGDLVFVGYGVVMPECDRDDFAGTDLKGKIAVVLPGAPATCKGQKADPETWAVMGDSEGKRLAAQRHGAVGYTTLMTEAFAQRASWKTLVRHAEVEAMVLRDGATPSESARAASPRSFVEMGAANRLAEAAGVPGGLAALVVEAEKPTFRSRDLGLRAELSVHMTRREVVSESVLGVLRGRDPARAREHVVYSSHLDHEGIGEPVDGDAIYNGAQDDASGVAGVLEVAKAFHALPQRPSRSVLFAAFTAEEMGLLGSRYFVEHPTVPLADIVADVNIDSGMPTWDMHDVEPIGARHSTLDAHTRRAAEVLGLAVSPESFPQQSFFTRSDQYNFVRVGIPSVFVNQGLKDARGDATKGRAGFEGYMKKVLHTPKDEWRPDLDFGPFATKIRLEFLVGLSVATTPERPAWNPGDLFASLARRKTTNAAAGNAPPTSAYLTGAR